MSLIEWALALPSAAKTPLSLLPGLTLITLVASKNDKDAVFSLLSRIDRRKHTDVLNSPDAYGNTALHYFALCKNRAAIEALICLGASLDATNHTEETPKDVCKSGSLGFSLVVV